MKIIETEIKDLFVIEPTVFGDARGWFMESWSEREFKKHGLDYSFVQDNQSFSARKGTLRGLHFQKGRYAQAKLVRCTRGSVFDVAVDLRKDSPTFLKWVGVRLSEENKKQLLIPRGFAHGFLTLTDDVEFSYKADNFYEPEFEGAIRYDDADIGIEWGEISDFLVSDKDKAAPFYRDMNEEDIFGE